MNALYDAASVGVLLHLAQNHGVPLLFVTNNLCNAILKYDTSDQLCEVR